jgi:hypothetical protein
MNATPETIETILNEARQAAQAASLGFFKEQLGGKDNYPCGFAWVEIYGVKGNTKLGRKLKELGVHPNSGGGLRLSNPGRINVQNVDVKEAGATAAANVLKKYGLRAYSNSRLD